MRTNYLISYLTLFSGLSISAVAIYYSICGLVSIFPGAVTSIIVMGAVLEISKLVATIWLKRFWNIAPIIIKIYVTTAIIILMAITSLGIYGFLARANMEQSANTGDIQDKIEIINEKMKIQNDIISSAEKSLSQLDTAVDQSISRTNNERGVQRSVNIRKAQKSERDYLLNSINGARKEISSLRDEKAPFTIQARKKSVEFGPIKSIAGLFFDDNDKNLESAVRYVIMFIVIVFDPLAVVLLLCSQYSFSQITPTNKKNQQHVNINIKNPTEEESEAPTSDSTEGTDDSSVTPDNDEETDIEITENILDILPDDPVSFNITEKQAKSLWKAENQNDTIKHQEKLFNFGLIDNLPWNKT